MVTIQPSIADIQEGQSLDLNCVTSGNPPPRVTWSRASGRLSSNHQVGLCSALEDQWRMFLVLCCCSSRSNGFTQVPHLLEQVLGNQLRILSATPEDSGEYVCRVQGNHGNPSSHVHQASVSVSVTSSSSRA